MINKRLKIKTGTPGLGTVDLNYMVEDYETNLNSSIGQVIKYNSGSGSDENYVKFRTALEVRVSELENRVKELENMLETSSILDLKIMKLRGDIK